MNVAEFRAQLETELHWRSDEILFFQNQCALVIDEQNQNKFRRALILLLYSNFEGLCKFALTLYVSAINSQNIRCRDAAYPIAAASLSDVFQYLRDGSGKSKEIKHDDLPKDKAIKVYARDIKFLETADRLMERSVNIPDSVVDAESNLNPQVLRKLLFRLGLPHDQFSDIEESIQQLLIIRNNIAHGETKDGVDEKLYLKLRDSAFRIMNSIISGITEAFAERRFLASAVYSEIDGSKKEECVDKPA